VPGVHACMHADIDACRFWPCINSGIGGPAICTDGLGWSNSTSGRTCSCPPGRPAYNSTTGCYGKYLNCCLFDRPDGPVDSLYFNMSNVHAWHLIASMRMTHQECCKPCMVGQWLDQVCRLLCVIFPSVPL
jgi:hypothetical protein